MTVKNRRSIAAAAGIMITALTVPAAMAQAQFGGQPISHVLLISIDGMHALDFLNCSKGISGANNGQPYCPTLAALAGTGGGHPKSKQGPCQLN